MASGLDRCRKMKCIIVIITSKVVLGVEAVIHAF